MTFKKTFNIKSWFDWDDIVFNALEVFEATYNLQANILQANEHTLSQFELIAMISPKRENAKNAFGQSPKKNELFRLSSFQSHPYDIDFAVNDKIIDKTFELVYDDDTEWDGAEISVPSPINNYDELIGV